MGAGRGGYLPPPDLETGKFLLPRKGLVARCPNLTARG